MLRTVALRFLLASRVLAKSEEVLDRHLFETLEQVLEISHRWLVGYNEHRPHDAWATCHRRVCSKSNRLNCRADGEACDGSRGRPNSPVE